MVRRTASFLVLATVLAASPSLADNALIVADASSSKSRAEARHDTSETSVAKSTNARSKARRATRHENASKDVQVTQNRGKRSRRTPGQDDLSAPMLADADAHAPGLVAMSANTRLLATHVQSADFTGDSGAMALYQLLGRAMSGMPMEATEKTALRVVMDGADLSRVVEETEARLMAAAAEGETLEMIAEALGVPRPAVVPGRTPNLGAHLALPRAVREG